MFHGERSRAAVARQRLPWYSVVMPHGYERFETRSIPVEAREIEILTPFWAGLPVGFIYLQPGAWVVREAEESAPPLSSDVWAIRERKPNKLKLTPFNNTQFRSLFKARPGGETTDGYRPFCTYSQRVWARRLMEETRVSLPGRGARTVPENCWLVMNDAAVVLDPVPDDIFREGYAPVTHAATRMWFDEDDKVYPVWPDSHPDRPTRLH